MKKYLIRLLCLFIPIKRWRQKLRNPSVDRGVKIISFWTDVWQKYLETEDIKAKVQSLKKGVDAASCEYIDKTLFLYQSYLNKTLPYEKAWCSEDLKKAKPFEQFKKSKMPAIYKKYKKSESFDPYLFFNQFGTTGFDYDFAKRINQKTVLDLGAYTGDSACMFLEYFSPKDVFAYEPEAAAYKTITNFVSLNKLKDKIKPVAKGLGEKEEILFIKKSMDSVDAGATFSDNFSSETEIKSKVEVTTIDAEVKRHDLDVGLIKMDIEGFEKKAVLGALETIKKQKPVLLISLYHNPVDFFDIKPLLEDLNVGYKFAIRRSEAVIPLGDIVLIAY